jgi:hypothetical protein
MIITAILIWYLYVCAGAQLNLLHRGKHSVTSSVIDVTEVYIYWKMKNFTHIYRTIM